MNLFADLLSAPPAANTRRVFWAFVALFAIGVGLRGLACVYTSGIIHPDEHQQFLEQAYRMIHGYGMKYWEQDRGMRHPLYHTLLAGPLRLLEALGIVDPMVQIGVIRFIVAFLALGAWAVFAWQFQRRGSTSTALLLMLAFALSPDVIFVHVHPLSEIAATIPFLLALSWLDRRPILAGVMLGVCFGIRFQMGFLIGGTVFLAGLETRFRARGPFLRFAVAALMSLLALGISDWLVFGRPFHSPIEYFVANILQGLSRQWGVHPWYQYFAWIWEYGGPVAVSLLAFMAIGAWREWKLGVLVAVFAAAHIAVAHKEERFLLPIVPLALALSAVGVVRGVEWLIPKVHRPIAMGVLLTAAAAAFTLRLPDVPWEPHERFRAASQLLYVAGRQPDLTGAGVLGIPVSAHGNYFFLKRDVRLLGVYSEDDPYFPDDPGLTDRRINYLISPPKFIHFYAEWQPEPIASRGDLTLYRLNRRSS